MPKDNKISVNKTKVNDSNNSGQQNPNSAKIPQRRTVETIVVTEEPVELFEHRVTEWQNDIIVSDVRKLMARPANQQMYKRIVTTETIRIPKQSLVVPIQVNQQIENNVKKEIIAVPIKVEQTDVPVIQTVELVEIPRKVTKRTTQITDHSSNENVNTGEVSSQEVIVEIESKDTKNDT